MMPQIPDLVDKSSETESDDNESKTVQDDRGKKKRVKVGTILGLLNRISHSGSGKSMMDNQ